MPFRPSAFPTISRSDPTTEPAVVYAIARQESTFNPRTVSSARAMGLMQVTPEAGRYVTKKFGATYDEKRLLSDQTYNVALGAAELGDLYADYRGSHIMTFAGYNAGRGRVKEWIARYGDPRDPKVDPIDWVERIPFSETRNYVQRVLENLQVYRVRFGGGAKLLIEADLRPRRRRELDCAVRSQRRSSPYGSVCSSARANAPILAADHPDFTSVRPRLTRAAPACSPGPGRWAG
jgi:soluble lytic murein transglycosylase